MEETHNATLSVFRNAAANPEIVIARFAVLDLGANALSQIADITQTSGWISRDDRELAVALLSRLGSELSGGIAKLCKESLVYAAGALLRQLVEIEYLMFLGCMEPGNLARWYRANSKDLRRFFSPGEMRKESNGLFRDEEYWLHCEVGGHPHPRARILLSAYENQLTPLATLLPDSVQHLRRLWTSVKMLLPKLNVGEIALEKCAGPFTDAIENWTRIEHPLIVSFVGIAADADETDLKASVE